MDIWIKATGEKYPEKYEWGKSDYWINIVNQILSKRNLSIKDFDGINNICIGDASYPINLITFNKGLLSVYDEINSPPWTAEENNKILMKRG